MYRHLPTESSTGPAGERIHFYSRLGLPCASAWLRSIPLAIHFQPFFFRSRPDLSSWYLHTAPFPEAMLWGLSGGMPVYRTEST